MYLRGWAGVAVVAIAAGLAELANGIPFLRKTLWTIAAAASVVIAYNTWKS